MNFRQLKIFNKRYFIICFRSFDQSLMSLSDFSMILGSMRWTAEYTDAEYRLLGASLFLPEINMQLELLAISDEDP